jgi:acylphosphatase
MRTIVAYKYIVSGRVQGVGFRWFVQQQAHELNIKGTVKNLINGDVEIIAQGDISTLEDFKSRVRKGPALSRVDTIKEISEDINNLLQNFKVLV